MTKLDKRHVAKAKKLVLDKFPEMAGAKPSVGEKRFQSKGGAARGDSVQTRYVLTFRKDISLPEGGELRRLVRVTMDGDGEVIRLTSSK